MIYARDCYSIHEVNGEEHQVWPFRRLGMFAILTDDTQLFCQNLSLFAKLFLENKSVCYDLTSFNYYLLVYNNSNVSSSTPDEDESSSQQVIGFFSKEKMSWDNNNLACILVFPPWQKRGLGKILMGVSYELSRKEGRIGGPEKRKRLRLTCSELHCLDS